MNYLWTENSWATNEITPSVTVDADTDFENFLSGIAAPRLKAAFPNLGICILGDALYACAPLMRICEGFGWDCIFTFKEGRTPTAYADAQKLMGATPGQSGMLVRHDRRGKRVEDGSNVAAFQQRMPEAARQGMPEHDPAQVG